MVNFTVLKLSIINKINNIIKNVYVKEISFVLCYSLFIFGFLALLGYNKNLMLYLISIGIYFLYQEIASDIKLCFRELRGK